MCNFNLKMLLHSKYKIKELYFAQTNKQNKNEKLQLCSIYD